MGSGVSLHIELHKQRGQNESTPAMAGNVLQGKVIIELTKPLWLEEQYQQQSMKHQPFIYSTSEIANNNHIDLSLLKLRIYGKEKVCMNLRAAKKRARKNGHTQALTSSSGYPYPVIAERKFFDVNLPLREFPQQSYDSKRHCIIPGIYKFPFQIQLPTVLPASCSYNPYTRMAHTTDRSYIGQQKHGFRIQYKMCVELHSITKKGIQSKPQYLWISSAPKASIQNDPVPSMMLPLPHELKNGGLLWSQGTVLTAAYLEDTIISRSDDHMNIHLACRNNSRADIQRVQLYLVENLRWGTVASTGDASSSVLQEENNLILFALQDIELPSLGKDRMSLLQSVTQTVFGTKNGKERAFLRSIYDDLKSEKSKLSITIPLQTLARDSYNGQLLQVSHHIEIHFLTSGTQKAKNPSIIIPIRMVNGDRHSIQATGSFCNSIAESVEEINEIIVNDPIDDFVNNANNDQVDEDIIIKPNTLPEQQQPLPIPMMPPPNTIHHLPTAVANIDDSDNDVMVVGGNTNLFYGNNKNGASVVPLADLIPLAPPTGNNMDHSIPTIQGLFAEMTSSVDTYNSVLRKVQTPDWIRFFENLSAYEFGQVIAHVSDPFDQPRVAILLGRYVNRKRDIENKKIDGKGLTCEYIAFALRNTSKIHRCTAAKGLLPMCVDAAENHQLVINELSEWDQTVIASELEAAILGNYKIKIPQDPLKVTQEQQKKNLQKHPH